MISYDYINLITEKVILNEKDIYYNKDKFDKGEVNLCFIIGHSGSGKSTMGLNMTKTHEDTVDTYCLDDRKYFSNLIEEKEVKESTLNENDFLTKKEKVDILSIQNILSPEDKKLMNDTINNHNPTGYKCFIEYDGNTAVSYFIIDKQPDDTADVSFAVRSDYRGKGYAKKVINKAMNYINSHLDEFTEIYWATKPNNKASQKLAEKYGFKVVRNDKEWKTYSKKGNKRKFTRLEREEGL